MPSPAPVGHNRSRQCQIIALCAPRSKDNILRLTLQCPANPLLRLADIAFRLHPLHMKGGGIAIILTHYLPYQIADLRQNPGSGCIIQITFHVISSIRSETSAQTTPPVLPSPSSIFFFPERPAAPRSGLPPPPHCARIRPPDR